MPTISYREEVELHQRRFLPHQGLCFGYSKCWRIQLQKKKLSYCYSLSLYVFPLEMVKGKGKSARQTRNLLLKMSSDQLDGPLNVLKEWKVQRKRVKVRERAFVRATTSNDMFCILTISQYLSGTFISSFS